jgi:hypothetical protein
MGTRSTIAIQNEDGTVTGIYCHWDGYLSHNGDILQNHYNTEAAVRELIALGDLSSLGSEIGEKHPFDTYNLTEGQKDPRWKDWCTAYGRDRGETNIEACTCHNWRQFVNEYGQAYDYLFVPGKGWHVGYFDGWDRVEAPTLAEALAQEKAAV